MSPRWLGVRHALRALAGGWLLLALSIAVRPRVHEDPVLLRYAPELVVAALLHVLMLPVLWRNRGVLARRFGQLLREGPTLGLADTMRLGAGFGFVDGLFEALSSFGWLALTGDPRQARSPLLLWMAPLVGAFWGVALGFLLGWLLRAHRGRGLNLRVPVFCFTTLTLYSIGLSLRPPLRGAAVLWLAAGVAWQLTRWVSRREPGLRRVVRLALPVGTAWVLLAGVGEWSLRHWRDSRAYRGLPAPAAGAPNVLLLILDTVRAPELSLYGYQRRTSPELERLAAGGVTFDWAIAPASWTLPTHATLFTGLLPHQLSADPVTPLDDSAPTLAEQFARNGYATAGFVGNLSYTNRATGLARGFAIYRVFGFGLQELLESSRWIRGLWHGLREAAGRFDHRIARTADELNREFLEWRRPAGRPFFAFLNYYDAHAPYVTRPPFETRFTSRPPRYWEFRPWAANSAADLQEAVDAYDSAIAYLDDRVGALLDALDRQGVLDQTVVAVASDHGEQFGEHGLTAHGNSLYLAVLHVPLVIRYPRGVPQGKRVRTPVRLRELGSTLLDLAGLPDRLLPGYSLRRYWDPTAAQRGDTARLSPGVFSEVRQNEFAAASDPVSRGDLHSLIAGTLHYIRRTDGREELFDFQADVAELNNLAPQRPTALRDLRRWLQRRLPPGVAASLPARGGTPTRSN